MDVYINENEHKILVVIDHSHYESIGCSSLTGAIVTECGKQGYSTAYLDITEVTIWFVLSSQEEREKNKGPLELIMLEYNPGCLVDDVLSLSKMVKEVKVEFAERDRFPIPPQMKGGQYIWFNM